MYDAGSRRSASVRRRGDNRNVRARHAGSLRRRDGRRHHRRNCHRRNRRDSYRRDYYRRDDGFDGGQNGVHHADNRIHNRGYHCRDGFQPRRFQNLIYRRHNYVDGVVHGVSDRSCHRVHHGSCSVRWNHLIDHRYGRNHLINRAAEMLHNGCHGRHVDVDLVGWVLVL